MILEAALSLKGATNSKQSEGHSLVIQTLLPVLIKNYVHITVENQ